MKTDRKPPLAKSPMRLRGRRVLRPPNTNTPLRTPAVSTKPQMKDSENRPEFNTVSYEIRALAKMVHDELGAINSKKTDHGSYASIGASNLFQRGRFYDVYSERRNERLMKKLSESEDEEPKTAYNLGVKVDFTKKKDYKKKTESLKKSMMAAANYSADRSQHPRYSLRSTAKKPPLPVPMYVDEKTTTARKAPGTRARRCR
ncbi:hypothetical protein RDABS01_011483 [Bienertia sinuspersici]